MSKKDKLSSMIRFKVSSHYRNRIFHFCYQIISLQTYIIINICSTRSIAFTVREAVHIRQWWYDEDNDDDDDDDYIHITLRIRSVRWQDRQALRLFFISTIYMKWHNHKSKSVLFYYFILLVKIKRFNEQT